MSVEMWLTPAFWLALGQIVLIDILLGGDNAVVIALACRKLSPELRNKGIFWGMVGAIGLRAALVVFAMQLLQVPYLKLVGAVLLLWIGIKLLIPEDEGGPSEIGSSENLWGAVRTVIVADFVMSVDNVIAIAGAAQAAGGDNSMTLVVLGLLISVPIIIWGSRLIITLMDRFPVVIILGGMLLGWIGGTMAITDPAVLSSPWMMQWQHPPGDIGLWKYAAGLVGAALVAAIGLWARKSSAQVKL
jgi:YjbE family integral membrane protein